MKILSEVEPTINTLSNKIKSAIDEIDVKRQQVQKEIFNLAENGHINIDFDYNHYGKFSSGQITFDGEVKRDSNSKFTINLNGGVGGIDEHSLEKLKKLIDQPQNLIFSKVSVKTDDWLLKTFNEDFKDVFRLQHSDITNGIHCIQIVLTCLLRSLSEKNCVGNDCSEGYTFIDKEAVELKIDGSNKDLNIDLDLNTKDHVSSLDISQLNLNFNIKSKEGNNNYLEVYVPSLSLNDITVNGQLKDKKIDFTGETVKTDLSTFKQPIEAKFNSLVLDLESNGVLDKVKTIEVDQNGNINFKRSILNQKIASVNFENFAK